MTLQDDVDNLSQQFADEIPLRGATLLGSEQSPPYTGDPNLAGPTYPVIQGSPKRTRYCDDLGDGREWRKLDATPTSWVVASELSPNDANFVYTIYAVS